MYNYSEKYDLFFIHIPKTAGTSINTALEIEPEKRGHRSLSDLYKLYKDAVQKTPCFAVARNPWDRVVSLYEFRKQKGYHSMTFKDWLRRGVRAKYEWTPFSAMTSSDIEKRVQVLRYENLREEWTVFAKKNRIVQNELPVLNTSNRKAYRDYYDEEDKAYIQEFFKKDIELLDYKF
jgi:hypothetical protein